MLQCQWSDFFLSSNHLWCTPRVNTWPLLFIIYLNDLPLVVKDAEITLYAEDTSLYKAFKNIKELDETQIPAFSNI